jgi:hypothetical protein
MVKRQTARWELPLRQNRPLQVPNGKWYLSTNTRFRRRAQMSQNPLLRGMLCSAVRDSNQTRFMKEILLFVLLCTFALKDFAMVKEKICKQRKEAFRVRVYNSVAIPISASAQTREQIAAMQAQIVARQAQKDADLAISQRDGLQAQPEDATLAASHRDSLLEDATLAASQRNSPQNQPKIRKTGANPRQQDVVSAADQSQPQQKPQSATSEALPAPVPAKLRLPTRSLSLLNNRMMLMLARSWVPDPASLRISCSLRTAY